MKENNRLLFGSKENFAIELGFSKNPKKFYLQFWLKSLQMGNFKKSDSLEMSMAQYKKIIKNKEGLYLTVFDGMSKDEIFKYTLVSDFDDDAEVERYDAMDRAGIFPFFGVQFMNQASCHMVLYKDGFLRFIWQNDFGLPLNDASIRFGDFCGVFEEYKAYCETNGLV